jgi:hypothetical protein
MACLFINRSILIFKLEEEGNAALLLHLPNFLQKQPFLVQRFVWFAFWLWRLHKQSVLGKTSAMDLFLLEDDGGYLFSCLLQMGFAVTC